MSELLCVDCLEDAIIQVVSEQGVPCGTYCQECWDGYQRLNDAIMQKLADAVSKLEPSGP